LGLLPGLAAFADTAPVSATFSSTPTRLSITTRLEPPELINGSGTPVSGRKPSTAPKLTIAWPATSVVVPAARYFPKGSLQRRAIRNPSHVNSANASTTARIPTRPSSSPITAPIMSVGASGRNPIFWVPLPTPTPVIPPDPSASSAWML
jgi:hypothetical protein